MDEENLNMLRGYNLFVMAVLVLLFLCTENTKL